MKTKTSVKKGQTREKHPAWKGGLSDKEKQRQYLRNQRNAVLELLGGKCVRCGFSDKRALQIDHIEGRGSKERKTRNYKGNFNINVINSHLKNENKYQLLCANCNWIKRVENNEVNLK